MIWMSQWSVHGVKMLLCKTAKKLGWAAELRQMRKRTKYEKQTMSTGETCIKVVPLVFERFEL